MLRRIRQLRVGAGYDSCESLVRKLTVRAAELGYPLFHEPLAGIYQAHACVSARLRESHWCGKKKHNHDRIYDNPNFSCEVKFLSILFGMKTFHAISKVLPTT